MGNVPLLPLNLEMQARVKLGDAGKSTGWKVHITKPGGCDKFIFSSKPVSRFAFTSFTDPYCKANISQAV